MGKFLDTKSGATFFEEMPNLTLCPRKDSIEFIFKLKPGIYVITQIDNNLLDKVMMLVNKNVEIYNELNTNPPFPAWKDGLHDLWN